jgi:choline dehydrogenase
LVSADPTVAPEIDHGYLSDTEQADLAVLLDGISIARDVMAGPIADGLIDDELQPGPGVATPEALADFIRRMVGIYYHPACSCRMGLSSDAMAVVDARGAVHGIENLYVCDASIFPTLMRANTNLPAAMVAEHLAAQISR